MKYWISLLCIAALWSCEKELSMNSSDFKKKLVINGFVAKDSVITCGISTSVSTLAEPQYNAINGTAMVVLLRNNLPLYNDVVTITNGQFSLPYVAKPGSTYELQVAYDNYNTIKAIDSVPSTDVSFVIDSLIDQGATYKLRFRLTDPIGAQKYLLQLTSSGMQASTLDSLYTSSSTVFTTNDKLFLTSIRTVALSNSFTIFDDALINNQTKLIEIVIDKEQYKLEGMTPEIISLKISCISETMYHFYEITLANTHIFGGPLATIITQKSNVEQGLGVFCFYTELEKHALVK
jgi:hypothetical protein